MQVKRAVFGVLLLFVIGCGEDSHRPSRGSPIEPTLTDLRLTVTVSAHRLLRGDTLDILLSVQNPRKRPVEVTFPESCQEGYWVYDDQGCDVTPSYGCYTAPSQFHISGRERRDYHLKWRACEGIVPGRYYVVAGFHPLVNSEPHRAPPIAVEVLHRVEDVTGEWTGVCFDFWGIPGWLDYRISMTLNQYGDRIVGTLQAGGPVFAIDSGSILDTEFVFTIGLAEHDLDMEFTGDVCGDGIRGKRRLMRHSTGQLLDTQYWHAERSK